MNFKNRNSPCRWNWSNRCARLRNRSTFAAPLRAARTRPQPVGVMRFRQHLFEALRKRDLPRQFPPARKPFQKFRDFSPRVSLWTFATSALLAPIERRPEMNVLRRQPDFRQFVERQADQRRAQHRDARNVLQRIVEQLQQAQQIQNFAAVKKSAALDRPAARRPARIPSRKFPPCPPASAAAPPCRAIRPARKAFCSSSQISCRHFLKFFKPQREQPRFLFRFLQVRPDRSSFVVGIRRAAALFQTQKQFRARRRIFWRGSSAARVSGEPNCNCASAS